MSKEQSVREEQTYANPIEDQRREALDHYREASKQAHYWSSFVEAAIKAYNPESLPATQSGEGNVTGWVSVKDRLPEFNKNVAGYTKNKRITMTFTDMSGQLDTQEIDEDDYYTHWHPLPKPPTLEDHDSK